VTFGSNELCILCEATRVKVVFSDWMSVGGIPAAVFWPYFAGIALTIVALVRVARREVPEAKGLDKVVVFGPLFLAVPMAVFGADHYMFWRSMGPMVPSWIPWHPFWILFVGTALIAAAVSIVVRRYDSLAATLLGIMIFLFVVLIHVPNLIEIPGDRFLLAVALRDTSFSAGAFAYALYRAQPSSKRGLLRLIRYVMGTVWIVFGVEHFLHPQNVPVVPLEKLLPPWIPGHLFLAAVTGTMLIACGVAVIFEEKAQAAATWLGTYCVLVVLVVYLPMLIAKPDVDEGLNYLADTMVFCGCALVLASALSHRDGAAEVLPERAGAKPAVGLHQRGEA
jgi:uncharacterized membrane protein